MSGQNDEKKPSSDFEFDQKAALEATGTQNPAVMYRLLNQTLMGLWFPEEESEEAAWEKLQSTIALLQAIKPTDEIEGMLAVQMVATHDAAMDCLRRATLKGQTSQARDLNLKHASKLFTIYARQVDALNKNRGKGQQKVTVEHVHVAAGGQAIVGSVAPAPKPAISGDQPEKVPNAIAHSATESFDANARPRKLVKQPKK